MMRTTLTIPDTLVNDLISLAHAPTTSKAVIVALEEWVKLKKIEQLKALRGKLHIEDNLQKLRAQEIKKLKDLNE